MQALRAEYAAGAHGIEVRDVAGGVTFAVADDCAEDVRRFTGAEKPDELTPALLETLAVVAYLEPVTRAEIAEVRGVSSEYALGRPGGARPRGAAGPRRHAGCAGPLRHRRSAS